ncbi:MAG: hypothetical protein H2060_10980 [Azoarcus sp.]|nr:hypothetical protein [Azoarcus sp.]
MDGLTRAIEEYGAQAVYEAAHRHMAGDTARGLRTVGLNAHTTLEAWRILDEAYRLMTEAQRATGSAQASARLARFKP